MSEANGKKASAAERPKLLDYLDGLTAADLADVDQEIESTRRKLASLVAARKLIDLRVNGPRAKEKKPKRVAVAAGSGADVGAGKNALQVERRKQVAGVLGTDGVTPAMVLANRLSIPQGSITSVLACDWFQQTSAGYRLTEVGRREAGIRGR